MALEQCLLQHFFVGDSKFKNVIQDTQETIQTEDESSPQVATYIIHNPSIHNKYLRVLSSQSSEFSYRAYKYNIFENLKTFPKEKNL